MPAKNLTPISVATAAHTPRAVIETLESRQLLSTVPAGFVDAKITAGIAQGTAMAVAPDGRIFIAQQAGKLSIVKSNKLLSTPFLTVVTSTDASEGLIGVAIDPKFSTNHFIYVSYTKTGPLRNVISRFTANGDVMAKGSEKIIFQTPGLENHEHNGGALAFGPDGKLYIALGDDFNINNAQSKNSTQGKILRINSDGTIPNDNPFFGSTGGNNRAIWAYGFRNPFTISFQPGTGRLFSGDVGSDFWEEVNDVKKGANYGWSNDEGPNVQAGETAPFYTYSHSGVNACIIGGPFYNPAVTSFPSSYVGKFFMADYARGTIRTLDLNTKAVGSFISGLDRCVAMSLGSDGSLYYLLRGGASGSGELHKVSYSLTAKPAIVDQPDAQSVALGRSVTFEVGVTGTTPLTYQWKRNGTSIPGANDFTYTIDSVSGKDNGAVFSVTVTNKLGAATSSGAKLTVLADSPPVPTITLPDPSIDYQAGQSIDFSATATDAEDGNLPASAFSWTSLLHHDNHTHPFFGPVSGIKSGTLNIPAVEETSSNVYYQLFLTVTDSDGVSTTVEQDIQPQKVDFTVNTNIAGMSVGVDSVTYTDPPTITGVTGIRRQLSAPLVQVVNGQVYQFDSWSDGGDATHFIFTPDHDKTYTANYTQTGTVGVGDGINADYYDNADFTGAKKSQTDSQVNFIWSLDPPVSGFGKDAFSVRWTGFIAVPTTEKYTFYANTDDGAKLWIDNKLVIDKFSSTGLHESSGTTATLQAGQKYAIKMEYKDVSGYAQAQLSWSSAQISKAIVPQSALFTDDDDNPPPPPPPGDTTLFNSVADTYVRQAAPDDNYGDLPTLAVKNDGDAGLNTREAYLKFDLTGLTTLTAASLKLTGKLNSAGSMAVGVYSTSNTPAWDEKTLTWNNKFAADQNPIATINVTTTTDANYSADLTSYLQSELSLGHTTVTLILKGISPGVLTATFHPREAAPGGPQLSVTVPAADPSP